MWCDGKKLISYAGLWCNCRDRICSQRQWNRKGKKNLGAYGTTTLVLHCLSLECISFKHATILLQFNLLLLQLSVSCCQMNSFCIKFILDIFLFILLIKYFSTIFHNWLLPRKRKIINLYLLLHPSTLQRPPIHTRNFMVNYLALYFCSNPTGKWRKS